MKGIIYRAVNLANGYSYIGQTRRSLSARIEQHFYEAYMPESKNTFHLALREYGKEGFEWSILDEFEGTKEEIIHALNVAEEYHILKHHSLIDDRGYNSTKGGYSSNVFADAIRRRAKLSKRYTPVLQYGLDGVFIAEYESMSAARKALGGKGKGCFIGKVWGGYQWKEKTSNDYPMKIEPYKGKRVPKGKNLAVLQYNKKGELLREYPSISAARRATGVSDQCIRKWCNTEPPFSTYHSATRWIWQYKRGEVLERLDVQGLRRKNYPDKEENRVVQLDSAGNEIRVWKNMYQASLRSGDPYGLIRKQCMGLPTKKKTAYSWRYLLDRHAVIA